jgi:hypothetical protein
MHRPSAPRFVSDRKRQREEHHHLADEPPVQLRQGVAWYFFDAVLRSFWRRLLIIRCLVSSSFGVLSALLSASICSNPTASRTASRVSKYLKPR